MANLAVMILPSRAARRKLATCAPDDGQTEFMLNERTKAESVALRVNGQTQRPNVDFLVDLVEKCVEWVSTDFQLAPTDFLEIEYDG